MPYHFRFIKKLSSKESSNTETIKRIDVLINYTTIFSYVVELPVLG